MNTENHIIGRSMADEPSQIDYNKDLECTIDGNRTYLPSSTLRRDEFYCDAEEYKQEIQDICQSCKETDGEELAALWHGMI
jgi:hypothetical protein